MDVDPAGPAPGARRAERPWWVPLVGVGSLGLGGIQALVAAALFALAALLPGRSAGAFALLGSAWAVPGIALAVAGFALLQGRPWARPAGFVAVGLFAVAAAALFDYRRELPPAVADMHQWAATHEQTPPALRKLLDEVERDAGVDTQRDYRDPRNAADIGFWNAACCFGAPLLPWYAVVLAVSLWRRREDP